MEIALRECPACGTVVVSNETSCTNCGAALPQQQPVAVVGGERVTGSEIPCPRCGATMPPNVLRCRDCGAYMNAKIEAAAMARFANRMYPAGGSGGHLVGGGAAFGTGFLQQQSEATSSFATVADDADFDLNPDVSMYEAAGSVAPAVEGQADFELSPGTTMGDYEVAAPQAPQPPAEPPAAQPAAGLPPAAQAGATGAPAIPEVPHSVQTGGDSLLDVALQEERDTQSRRKAGRPRIRKSVATAVSGDRFLVYCPNGHRIQVHHRHRGRTGRCPNCKSLFHVPPLLPGQQPQPEGDAAPADAAATAPAAPQGYATWVNDVWLHSVNPSKLKLKTGSLEAEHDVVDLGFCPDNLLLARVYAGGGPFRGMQAPKKTAANRQLLQDGLAQGLPLSEIAIPGHQLLTPGQLQQLKIVQPAIPGEESLFADIAVFGEGRIAVRVPAADKPGERAFLSFSLSQFRQFSAALADVFGLADFGAGTSIPMSDEFVEATCHYSDSVLHSIPPDRLGFYRADPSVKLVVLGRKCQKCGLVVSEDSRKKEKIGGSSDGSIARARCPKCKQKFGTQTLWGLSSTAAKS